jgi:hypothetical protein
MNDTVKFVMQKKARSSIQTDDPSKGTNSKPPNNHIDLFFFSGDLAQRCLFDVVKQIPQIELTPKRYTKTRIQLNVFQEIKRPDANSRTHAFASSTVNFQVPRHKGNQSSS